MVSNGFLKSYAAASSKPYQTMANVEDRYKKISVKIGGFIFPINPQSVSVELSNTIVQLTVPGRDGNIIQNLGSGSRKINLGGTFGIQDYDVWEFEKQIISLLRTKSPLQVTFPIVLNDIGTNVTMCVVESIKFNDEAARLNMIDYSITLIEWRDASIEKVGVNLVNSGPVSQFISVLQRRRVGVPTNFK